VEEAGVALQVVSMEKLRMEVVLEPERTGDSVAEVCRRRGISRETFYVYRRRYLSEGIDGLVSRSRRPRGSPARIEPELEATICGLRREHPRWGARRIRTELARAGVSPPAKSTIHRALQRNGLVAPQPPRRPKPTRRFERPVANDLWQIDATQLKLAGGERVWIVDVLDDHARYLLAALASERLTGVPAWACFVAAAAQHGLPRQLLSDNGTCFTGRLHGFQADFERRLGEVGVELICAAPAHPETLGKLERFHRTLKEWLHDQGPASDLEQLQRLLDRFRTHYNEERPHQGISDLTPAERYWPTPVPVEPLGELTLADQQQPSYPARALVRNVSKNGMIAFQNMRIGVGRRYAGANLRLVPLGELVHIYYDSELIRVAALDRRRYYQPQTTKSTRGR
jgi:transposase InsO family protein